MSQLTHPMPSTEDQSVALRFAYWVNNEPQEHIKIADRGLQYGDGFFTTIAIQDGCILNWQAHWQRIANSAVLLGLGIAEQATLLASIRGAANLFLEKNGLRSATLKILFTRGEGGKGYAPLTHANSTMLFYFKPLPPQNQVVLETVGVSSVMMPTNSFQGVKSLNRLENVLARKEALQKNWHEAIMLDFKQQAICGTQTNLFLVNDQQISTPKLEYSGIRGTTRASLLPLLGEQGYQVVETEITMQQIIEAQELFFCNAIQGIQAAKQLQLANHLVTKTTQTTMQICKLWQHWQQQTALALSDG